MSYICKNCGVELEDEMKSCPLCFQTPNKNIDDDVVSPENQKQQQLLQKHGMLYKPRKKLIWEIISITIFSLIIVALSINLILSQRITWSEYPVAICLVIFSYISIFAFLNKSATLKIIGGFVASLVFLLLVDALTGSGLNWVIQLAIPLLFSGNVITALLLFVVQKSKQKGINIIAYIFIAVALYCMCIEAILSFFTPNEGHLLWSIIVVACLFPVAFVLFYVHYRLTKNHRFERTFHL